jgi:ABC-type uncharacterized transport system auxiliary subunit
MKKFFAIAFIAATLVACNNSGEKKPAEDTTKPVVADTTAPAPVVADTTAPVVADTTAK